MTENRPDRVEPVRKVGQRRLRSDATTGILVFIVTGMFMMGRTQPEPGRTPPTVRGVGYHRSDVTCPAMNRKPSGRDLVSRHDQELAHLNDRWIPRIPVENRAALEAALRTDPWLTHQVTNLIRHVFIAPGLAVTFLAGIATHLAETDETARRPVLAGLIAVGGYRTPKQTEDADA